MADTRISIARVAPTLLVALLLAACGGGGGGAIPPTGGGGGDTPPDSLTYAAYEAVYRTDTPIAAVAPSVTGGAPSSYSVVPDLPNGLQLDPTTGVVTGTPTAPAPSTAYVVTGSNDHGQASGTMAFEVQWVQHKSLAAMSPAALGDADLRHFLVRTHWGVTNAKLTEVQTLGLEPFIDQMLVFPTVGTAAWEVAAENLHIRKATDPAGWEGYFPTLDDLTRWWIYLMKENPNTFQEVLAFHWHDHFATSSEILTSTGRRYYMRKHVDMLREYGNKNVRSFLLEVARDWTMLWWLDGYVSTKTAPNENFAREWLELFTLGVEAEYTQFDIVEGARAFTGYQDLQLDLTTGLRHMVWRSTRHDPDDKTFLGVLIPGQNTNDDYETVVNITIDNRPVAEWLARSLLRGFCYPDPETALVDQLAQVMRDANYELAPVLKTLFLSEAFYSAHARRAIVKGPVDHAMGFLLSTGLRVRDNDMRSLFLQMGNVPTQPPTVNGWPGGEQWLSAQGMVDRANYLQVSISYGPSITEQNDHGLDLRALLPAGDPTSLECVDALALLLAIPLEPAERTRLALYLDTSRQGDGTVVASPFDANDNSHIQERIRGLLYVLGQHPNYMVR